ncbi:MBL fold metallo-hydrolase [Aliivibrio fischeri]|uniref:MBL fold metallo-hydrolase n=1 Tax=Aliivibrio fischeri TaxID=668 RepID=UPI0012D87085|nr:hydrolase [Aliivibrio fischeri]MUK73766.1 hydrolase [Aliivibrio fischeri]MUK75845.1 hydrolase [Aliivibrio fischeri]
MKKERTLIINKKIALIGVTVMAFTFSYFQQGEKDSPIRFKNSEMEYTTSASNIWDIAKAYISTTRTEATPKNTVPVQAISIDDLMQEKEAVLYRLGHSSVLIKLDGQLILTDPVFSDRASPVQWAGPKRFHAAPISIADLPTIQVVAISHDHYDHLDKHAVKQLNDKVEHFVVPLRVGDLLKKWGVEENKITEFDWWQSHTISHIEFSFAPTQHFSGRGLTDKNSTLWGSWAIKGKQANLFFSGDSGYFSGFKEIGDKYGPFDLTMIETGAYNELWSDIHMFPSQSVQAHLDVKGQTMMPIHNSTFDLALHDWQDPLEQVSAISTEKKVRLITPMIGEKIIITVPKATSHWWREM